MTTHGATLTIGTMLACTACKCHLFAEELEWLPSPVYLVYSIECPDCETELFKYDSMRETVHRRAA